MRSMPLVLVPLDHPEDVLALHYRVLLIIDLPSVP
jgi:hypothetical protein